MITNLLSAVVFMILLYFFKMSEIKIPLSYGVYGGVFSIKPKH